jgi:Zn-dependent peptidase ImmA (M78 family)/transcriptional regulator with XRE-family HTH domain
MQDHNSSMTAEDKATARSLGFRIRAARDAKGMSQEALRSALGIADRQTISAIENGERAVKPEELVRLCSLLEQNLDYFLDPFVVAGEAEFSWRATDTLPDSDLNSFEVRAGQWVGLLRFLRRWNASASDPFSFSLRLSPQSTFEEALTLGESVAEKLELGSVPAARLTDQVESVLDIPVLFVDAVESTYGSVSGATCHLPDLGVILINRNEPEARRNYDLAHELFHAVTWGQMKPDHRDGSKAGSPKSKSWRIEKLADNFAAGLLMPRAVLDRAIDPRRIDEVGHLVDVADFLRVSPSALGYRLFNAKLISQVLCDSLRGATSRLQNQGQPKRFSSGFVELLRHGIERGQVSARKVAKALAMTMPELADLFAEHSTQPAPFAL